MFWGQNLMPKLDSVLDASHAFSRQQKHHSDGCSFVALEYQNDAHFLSHDWCFNHFLDLLNIFVHLWTALNLVSIVVYSRIPLGSSKIPKFFVTRLGREWVPVFRAANGGGRAIGPDATAVELHVQSCCCCWTRYSSWTWQIHCIKP